MPARDRTLVKAVAKAARAFVRRSRKRGRSTISTGASASSISASVSGGTSTGGASGSSTAVGAGVTARADGAAGGSMSMPWRRVRTRFTATTPNPKMSTATIRIGMRISMAEVTLPSGCHRVRRRTEVNAGAEDESNGSCASAHEGL